MHFALHACSTMDISGLILAGGKATRMGGRDKGLVPLQARPMVAHVIARLAPQVRELAINANRNLDEYTRFGHEVWPDLIAGFAGPLAGLHAGLSRCRTPLLAVVPCDAPMLPLDLVERLAAALEGGPQASLAVTGERADPQPQPVFCLLSKNLLPHLARFIDAGGRSLDAWLRSIPAVPVHFADEAAFANLNTPEDLARVGLSGAGAPDGQGSRIALE